MTPKKLTKYKACQAKFLLGFNFVISYTPSKDNAKSNILTRQPNDSLSNDYNN